MSWHHSSTGEEPGTSRYCAASGKKQTAGKGLIYNLHYRKTNLKHFLKTVCFEKFRRRQWLTGYVISLDYFLHLLDIITGERQMKIRKLKAIVFGA